MQVLSILERICICGLGHEVQYVEVVSQVAQFVSQSEHKPVASFRNPPLAHYFNRH